VSKIPTILYVYGDGVGPAHEQRHRFLPSLKYSAQRNAWRLTYRNAAGEVTEAYVDGGPYDWRKVSVDGQYRFKELTGVDVDEVHISLQE
jgi:hypothetical protein